MVAELLPDLDRESVGGFAPEKEEPGKVEEEKVPKICEKKRNCLVFG